VSDNSETDDIKVARAALAGLALLLTVAGQLALQAGPTGLGAGTLLTAMGLLLFIGNRMSPPAEWWVRLVRRLALTRRSLLVLGAVTLSILATLVDIAWPQLGRNNYLPVIILWAGAALLYAAAFVDPAPDRLDWRAWLRAQRGELIGLAVLLAVAAWLRFQQLGSLPRVIDGDEGRLGMVALASGRGTLANPFVLVENFGGLYLQTIGLALAVLGRTPLALRLAPAVGGLLAIPAVYLLGRYLFGRRVAWVGAGLLAVAHAHIHFSRIVAVAYLQETWLIPLELYFFFSGLERRSRLRLALGGLLLGAHFSVYISAQIVTALLLVYLLIAAWLCRPLVQAGARSLWAFGLGLLVTGLPQFVHAARNPNDFFARLNIDGTFQSGWLAGQMAATGQPAVQILAERVAHAFLAVIHYPAIDFYGARLPLLDPFTATLFLLGLAYAFWRTREARFLLVNGYFWSLTVAIGVFAIPPSADSYRMLVALPAAILLAAVGLEQASAAVRLTNGPASAGLQRWVRPALSVFLAVALLTLNVRAYYFDFVLRCQFGLDSQTRFASYLGNYLRTVDRDVTVYLLSDSTYRYGTHVSAEFLGGKTGVTNFDEPALGLPTHAGLLIIAPPSRMEELRQFADQVPGGSLHREDDCEAPMLLAYALP